MIHIIEKIFGTDYLVYDTKTKTIFVITENLLRNRYESCGLVDYNACKVARLDKDEFLIEKLGLVDAYVINITELVNIGVLMDRKIVFKYEDTIFYRDRKGWTFYYKPVVCGVYDYKEETTREHIKRVKKISSCLIDESPIHVCMVINTLNCLSLTLLTSLSKTRKVYIDIYIENYLKELRLGSFNENNLELSVTLQNKNSKLEFIDCSDMTKDINIMRPINFNINTNDTIFCFNDKTPNLRTYLIENYNLNNLGNIECVYKKEMLLDVKHRFCLVHEKELELNVCNYEIILSKGI